ncbi:MAG: NnrS family protein [Chloroflexi bacterium]|nr:NnrS family protein [Chloroflexota bacterium]
MQQPPNIARETLFRPFMVGSLVTALTLGFTLGATALLALAAPDALGPLILPAWPDVIRVHGLAQLYGWVGLFIMGAATHILPRFGGTPLRRPALIPWALWLTVAALVARAVGLAVGSWLDMPAAVLQLAGVTAFAAVAVETLRHGQFTPHHPRTFLLAAFGWLWLATALGVVAAVGRPELVPVQEHLLLLGFAANAIFGVSLRAVVGFLALRPWPPQRMAVAWGALQSGLALSALGLIGNGWLGILGAALELAAAIGLASGLGIFRPPVVRQPVETWQGFARFLRGAYGWLVAGTALGLAGVLSAPGIAGDVLPGAAAAARHSLALGFVTWMIFGMAYRVVPVFTGKPLAGARLADVSFWLLLTGTVLRVGPVLTPGWPLQQAALALGGVVATLALTIFAAIILRTLYARPSAAGATGPVQVSFQGRGRPLPVMGSGEEMPR